MTIRRGSALTAILSWHSLDYNTVGAFISSTLAYKFVVMAMKPGADLDSLPILDNQDNFVAHAYAAFILEFSYVALNKLPQLNSFRSYSTRSFSKQRLFICRMPDFWIHYLLGITDRKSCW